MKTLTDKWSGTIQGTNSGTVTAEFTETSKGVSGIVRIHDRLFGLGIYTATGQVRSDGIYLVLTPDKQTKMARHGTVIVDAHMVGMTKIDGNWRSSIGTGGTLTVTRLEAESVVLSQNSREIERENLAGKLSAHESVRNPERTKVFISYSHYDTPWIERLRVHLKPLERDYDIKIWDDRKIRAGSKWKEEIEEAIRSAKVAVLIISADFLASDFIVNNELPPLLDAAETDGAVILPLIVSPSRFLSTKSLSQFQAINDPARPLISMAKGEQEETLVKVSEDIEIVLKSVPIN